MTPTTKERRNPLTLRMAEPVAAVAENRGGARLPYTQIRTDGGTQMRAGLNEATAAEYADELRRGAVFPPVLVFFDGQTYWLGDGFHRVRAYFLAYGDQVGVPCEVRPGTRRDAVLCAAGANAVHGLRRTNADKRRAVEALLRDEEWGQWSDREIARRCHVSHNFVSELRHSLSSGDNQTRPILSSNDSMPAQRSYVHPRTGKPTLMRVAGIAEANRGRAITAATDGEPQPILSSDDSMPEPYPLSPDQTMGLIRSAIGRGAGADPAAQRREDPVVSLKPHSNGAAPIVAGGLHVNGAQNGAQRRAELLALYRQVVSTLGEYGALTGMHTHTPAVRRALEPLIEELRKR